MTRNNKNAHCGIVQEILTCHGAGLTIPSPPGDVFHGGNAALQMEAEIAGVTQKQALLLETF